MNFSANLRNGPSTLRLLDLLYAGMIGVLLVSCEHSLPGLSSVPDLPRPAETAAVRTLGVGCLTQADCVSGSICVALAPGRYQCINRLQADPQGQLAPSSVGKSARPAPPVGLLSGDLRKR